MRKYYVVMTNQNGHYYITVTSSNKYKWVFFELEAANYNEALKKIHFEKNLNGESKCL